MTLGKTALAELIKLFPKNGLSSRIEALEGEVTKLKKQRTEVRTQRDQFKLQRDQAREQRDARLANDSPDWAGQEVLEAEYKAHPPRHERIGQHIEEVIKKTGLGSGSVLEIGGREYPYKKEFEGWEYQNLDISETGPGVIMGDITSMPHVADESFDVILSVDVFEHINRPWLAANEITRLLKPGGIAYQSTLFSWRYHPCPIDYWRFTPEALKFLFSDLECLECEFDGVERRRDIVGKGKSKIKRDAFGGWRENWRVCYVGQKK